MRVRYKKRLSEKLLGVAEAYFNGERVETSLGICRATGDYFAMEHVMASLNEPGGLFAPYTTTRKAWAPRAWMCLFLVEYLKG